MIVYISSPYRDIDVNTMRNNVYHSLDVADELLKKGHIPIAPLLFHFWNVVSPKSDEEWLRLDKAYICMADCLLRLPGESKGADIECAYAEGRGMTVYHSIQEIPDGP